MTNCVVRAFVALGFFGGTLLSGSIRPSEPISPQSSIVRDGSAATDRVRLRTAFGATPFAAVTVIGNEPAAVGVSVEWLRPVAPSPPQHRWRWVKDRSGAPIPSGTGRQE